MATATVGMTSSRAKAARQKKLAIGGAVLLVGILAIQGPKLMKMVSGGSSSTAAPAAPAAPATPATPATPTPLSPAPTPVTPSSPAPAIDQLVSFETFRTKDPFVQQVTDGATSSVASSSGGSSATDSGSSSSGSSTGDGSTASQGSSSGASSGTGSGSSSAPAGGTFAAGAGFTVAGSETKPPASPTISTAAVQVNGSVETVDEGKTFPRSDPVFKLAGVSEGFVQVSIAGGSLKNGGEMVKIAKGKTVTLKNTSTGKSYRIELISTSPA